MCVPDLIQLERRPNLIDSFDSKSNVKEQFWSVSESYQSRFKAVSKPFQSGFEVADKIGEDSRRFEEGWEQEVLI